MHSIFFTIALCSPTDYLVDANGSGDFVHLQDALDAAAPGDRVFLLGVQDGAPWKPYTVSKSVSILGLAGARIEGGRDYEETALVIDAPGADVVLEDLELAGGSSDQVDVGCDALRVLRARAVRVERCTLEAGTVRLAQGDFLTDRAGDGIDARRCGDLVVRSSTIRGARGPDQQGDPLGQWAPGGQSGGHGVYLGHVARARVEDSTIEGGDAGDYTWIQPLPLWWRVELFGGDGGAGIFARGAPLKVERCALAGGRSSTLFSPYLDPVWKDGRDGLPLDASNRR